MDPEKEITLLETLLKEPVPNGQRDLARTIGASLGLTNVLLKRLAERGWVIARHLTARKLQYAVTSEGLKELSVRSYRYLKKTVKQIAEYKTRLQTWLRVQKTAGRTGVILHGRTELDFLVEALARQEGLDYHREIADGAAELEGWTVLHGEEEAVEPNLLTLVEA